MNSLLKVEGLDVYTRSGVQILDGISFSLGRGASLGVVGESGSGKSILMRSLVGLAPPTMSISGSVLFKGSELLNRWDAAAIRGRGMAMVFQDALTSLNPVMSIGSQFQQPLRFHFGLSKREAEARALELLDLVGVSDPRRRLSQHVGSLSGGMRQRVMIALALSCEPEVLIADEPTTALDVTIQGQVLDLLLEIQQLTGMALLLVTHDLAVVSGYVDDVAVMYGGQIVEYGATRSVFKSPAAPYTEALLQATPLLEDEPGRRLNAIAGQPPAPGTGGSGCRFSARCNYVQPDCIALAPVLRPMEREDMRLGRCHHPREAGADPDVGGDFQVIGPVARRETDARG